MDTSTEITRKNRFSIILVWAAIISFLLYFLTCFRTFTWWDSSEYSLAALTMGVPHPPGSLLTVILGWIASKLPFGIDKFFTLNLLASLMAAIAVYLVGYLALKLCYQTNNDQEPGAGSSIFGLKIGAFLGALMFGVSATTWYYAIRFTPYMTTALLTALIIAAIFAWQRRSSDSDSHLWLGLVALLFGLDFSVHRTNLLMLPAFLIWVMIFYPRAFLSVKHWISGIIGLAIGLLFQLLIIPIASSQPFINFNDPSSLSRFWDYITVKQYGGGWLINIFPRKAPFFSIQVADYIKIFGSNFANSHWLFMGYLPLIIGLAGLIFLFKRNWKIGLGLGILFIFSSLGAILYFNLPQNFFRSIDRHYMPSFVIFGILIAYGAASILHLALNRRAKFSLIIGGAAVALMAIMPIQATLQNYDNIDGSKSYFAYDTAKNFLSNLPQETILITQADIDTYPLWCLQAAEGLRPDVTICNLSLLNTPWFIEQLQNKDSNFPVRLSKIELNSLTPIPWSDSTITLQVGGDINDFGLTDGAIMPASINLTVSPTIQGKYILVQDQMILKTILANNWKRPICFSSMISEQSLQWLKPYLRMEGLYWRLVPIRLDTVEKDLLNKNLVNNYNYRGFTDPAIPKEEPTKWVAWNYCNSFLTLSSMEYTSGDTLACKNTMAQLHKSIPYEELSPPPDLLRALSMACK